MKKFPWLGIEPGSFRSTAKHLSTEFLENWFLYLAADLGPVLVDTCFKGEGVTPEEELGAQRNQTPVARKWLRCSTTVPPKSRSSTFNNAILLVYLSSLLAAAAMAQLVRHPELRALEEVQLNWHEFDFQSQYWRLEKNPRCAIYKANIQVSERFRK